MEEKVEIYIKYKINSSGEIKESFIENSDYETALDKFLKVKGGKDKITILMARDWNRGKLKFEGEPLLLENKNSIVYKIMNK